MKEIKRNVILLGDGAVGKTSLIRRFVLDQFNDNYISTIGTKVTKKEIEIDSHGSKVRVILMIWDVIGQKDYGLTQSLSMRKIAGAILVSDLTRKETLASFQEYWIPKIKASRGNIPMVFLGNKTDLESERQFGLDEINKVAEEEQEMSIQSFLTSAKTGEHIDTVFELLAKAIVDDRDIKPCSDGKETHEVKNLANIIDKMISDFSDLYGGIVPATPIVKHQMELSGLDPINPDKMAMEKFIDRIAEIEGRLLKPHDVAERKSKRIQLMNSIDF